LRWPQREGFKVREEGANYEHDDQMRNVKFIG
jgi:hypothetical protein